MCAQVSHSPIDLKETTNSATQNSCDCITSSLIQGAYCGVSPSLYFLGVGGWIFKMIDRARIHAQIMTNYKERDDEKKIFVKRFKRV